MYNFSPAFRAENSRSRRHLCEFSMIEAEEAFVESTPELLATVDGLLRHCVDAALRDHRQDLEVHKSLNPGEGDLDRLERFLEAELGRVYCWNYVAQSAQVFLVTLF